MVLALSPQAMEGVGQEGGGAYMERLLPAKQELDELYASTVEDGHGLVEVFSRPPIDPHSPVGRINEDLSRLEKEKEIVDRKWEEAWLPFVGERGEPIGQSPSHSSKGETTPTITEEEPRINGSGTSVEIEKDVKVAQVHSTTTGSEVRKVSQVGVVTKKNSDKYSELEEEAYEVKGQHRSFKNMLLQGKGSFGGVAYEAKMIILLDGRVWKCVDWGGGAFSLVRHLLCTQWD